MEKRQRVKKTIYSPFAAARDFMPSLKVHGLRTGAAAYFLAAVLTLACAAFFVISWRRGAQERPVPGAGTNIQAGYYSYKSRLLASQSGLTGFKNKIEKRLESGFLRARSFGLKDADGLLRLCMSLDPLLLEMSGSPYPQPSSFASGLSPGTSKGRGPAKLSSGGADPYLSQLTAARASARELIFEAAKLNSLIKGSGPDSAGVLRPLAVVEGSIDRLQTHIEGLAR